MSTAPIGMVTPFPVTKEEREIDLGHFPTIRKGDWLGGHVYPSQMRHWEWSPDSLLLLPLSAATIEEAMIAYQDMAVVNANVVEWLLKHPDFIPEEWKRYSVHFLGSFFTHKVIASPFIYCLEYQEDTWIATEARYNAKPTIGRAQLVLFK
jgi:hypothetical protein